MTRYSLLNDLAKAHRTHVLREARRAQRIAPTGKSRWPAILKSLRIALS